MVRALAVLVVGAAIMTHGLETVALEEIVEQQANEIAELKQKAAQHEQKMTRVEKENARMTDKNAAPYGPQAMDQEVLGQDGEAGKDPAYQCETGMRQCMSLANAVQLREALDASSTAKVQASSESLQSSKKGLQSASSPTSLLHTTWRGTSPPGTVCTSACHSGAPLSDEPLGFPGNITSWCYTDVDSGQAPSKRLWGECGGCAPGKYKPAGSSVCSGSCGKGIGAGCATCLETSSVNEHDSNGLAKWRVQGSEGWSCTSCPSGSYFQEPWHTDHLNGACTADGTKHKVVCVPSNIVVGGYSGPTICAKTGEIKFYVRAPRFFEVEDPNCGNWWAVRVPERPQFV